MIVFLGLVLSFVLIRISTRLMRSPKVPWWPGSIESGDLHVHHLVFGNVMVLFFGFVLALQPASPWLELSAAGFGIGAGLTLDEFALWLHLEDVYWAEEGRRSVDAVVIAVAVAGLLLLGFLPVSTEDSGWGIAFSVLLVLARRGAHHPEGQGHLRRGRHDLRPVLGIFGAIRLAKPGSFWARRRYKPGSKKLARSEKRYARKTARYRRFQDRIAGAPSIPPAAEPAGEPAER